MQVPSMKLKEGDSVNIKIMISSYGVGWERIRGVGIVTEKLDHYSESDDSDDGLNQSEVKNVRVLAVTSVSKNAKGSKVHIT